MRLTPRFSRKPLLASVAAVALGLAAVGIPGAFAVQPTAGSAGDAMMYDLAVRAADGNGAALAERLVAGGFDVVSRQGAVVHVLGTTATVSQLVNEGGVVAGRRPAAPVGAVPAPPASQDEVLPERLQGKTYDTYYGGYRTVTAYDEFESDLAAEYPRLVKKVRFGRTFTGAYPLNAVCVTVGAQHGCKLDPNATSKARFLLMAQIHAREIATSEMAWRYLAMLVDTYGKGAQITSLLKSSEIWVVPQFNIDGIATVQKGLTKDGTGGNSRAWQRKNLDARQAPGGTCPPPWAGSQVGVDLNRNFDSHWDTAGVSHDPCSEVYDGRSAASEKETQELSGLFGDLFRDQRAHGDNAPAPLKTTGAMVTMHTVAGLVLFPWGQESLGDTRNDEGLRSLAFRQSYFNGYAAGQPGEVLYEVSGTTDDWAYDKLGIGAFTWELDGDGGCGGTFFPTYSCMDDYEANNLPGLVYAAAAARTPYKLGLGPTMLDVHASASGSSVDVIGHADDNAYGSSGAGRPTAQRIEAARIFVGTAPWNGGQSKPMKVKGSGTDARVTAQVDRGAARVLAYVQARDADGNWGPVLAVWIPATS